MKRILSIALFMILIFVSCFSFSCASNTYSHSFYYFNTQIQLHSKNSKNFEKAVSELDQYFFSLEQTFSVSEENSFINSFNSSEKGSLFTLDTDFKKEIFELCTFSYNFTDKKFNPAIFPLVKLWQFYPNYPVSNFEPPNDEEISNILSSGITDFSKIAIDENDFLIKPLSSMQLDLGGILKGYALDKASEILALNGINKGYINVGSSSLYLLEVDSLGVRHPRATQNKPLILDLSLKKQKNLFVSTSGDYEKTYAYNDKVYSHIIDNKTGKPADTNILSATLIGQNGGLLDAFSTALCLCTHNSGDESSELITFMNKILLSYPKTKIFVVYSDGDNKEILTNQKQGENFTLLDTDYKIVNI